MAEDLPYGYRSDNKRKFDEPTAVPSARRPTGFSAPIASTSPDNPAPPAAAAAIDGIELAKRRAQEIAARIFSSAEAKRPKFENDGGGGSDDSSDRGFHSASSDYSQKFSAQTLPTQGVAAFPSSFPNYGHQVSSKRVDIPNGRVGIIIGKGGETIRYLQLQSGAKIQVTRDADADRNSQTRPVELVGTPEQVSKAEELINDVLAEAASGGSGTIATRIYGAVQGGSEQFTMTVPNHKVGLVIGKGGETIKNMQAKSGARIQLIPLHPPPDYALPERTVQIDGTSEQIELAKQLVNEVISENRVRNPQMAGGYQQYHPSRPTTSWAPPGPPPMQQPGYGYVQPGAYPAAPSPYNLSQPSYGAYPPPSGWDQQSNPATQHTTPGSGYDYYSQQQQQQQPQQPSSGGTSSVDTTSYNYGQQPANYNLQGPYDDSSYPPSTVAQQGYGQDGYSGAYQQPSQPGYSQPVSTHSGYDQSQGYGTTAPAYGVVANPTQDGSASTYGVQSVQVSSGQQLPQAVQSPATKQQQSAATASSYTSQGVPLTSQAAYGSQLPAQTGYGQPVPPIQSSYGQPPQGPKPSQAVHGQGQQTPVSQSGYIQPAATQTGYSHGQPPLEQSGSVQDPTQQRPNPTSGFASGLQLGYGQQQPYGGVPPQAQPGYGQQQQSYVESNRNAGYSQPTANSNDNSAHGPHEGSAANAAVPGGMTKASSQG